MKKVFKISGMHCSSCAMLIEDELDGRVIKANVDYADEKAEIEYDERKISEKEIREIIKKAGYDAK